MHTKRRLFPINHDHDNIIFHGTLESARANYSPGLRLGSCIVGVKVQYVMPRFVGPGTIEYPGNGLSSLKNYDCMEENGIFLALSMSRKPCSHGAIVVDLNVCFLYMHIW